MSVRAYTEVDAMPEVLSGTLGASRARVRARLWRVLVGLSLAVCSVAESEQMVAHFNGDGHAARVDVNGFSRSPDRLAASDTNMRLGPPGSGFPGDGTDGRALDAGVSGTHPQHLHVPVDGEADFSQGTFEAWVKTTWDWTDPERHSFIELRMAGEKRNGLNLCYDGRAPKRGLCFKMNDGDGTGDHCTSYDVAGLEWRKGEWHHIAASWTPRSSWLFADGKLVARAMHSEVMVFSPAAGPLRVGEPDWLFATPCAALIDEVRVCDVPLHVGRDSILPWAPALLDGAEVTASSTSEPVVSVEDVPKLHDGLYGKGALLGRTQTTGYVLVAWDEPKRVSGVRWSRD
ncbi:MAG TPA: LamG-like jellyroll fold domain-containing protein, partial [Armatimonadota bacterium]|nr:LamG-like jellyroll fold domain-containing protein [Armatimonadota bacterium]